MYMNLPEYFRTTLGILWIDFLYEPLGVLWGTLFPLPDSWHTRWYGVPNPPPSQCACLYTIPLGLKIKITNLLLQEVHI